MAFGVCYANPYAKKYLEVKLKRFFSWLKILFDKFFVTMPILLQLFGMAHRQNGKKIIEPLFHAFACVFTVYFRAS